MSQRESTRHARAKARLARWLRWAVKNHAWGLDRFCSVRVEYPLCRENVTGTVWHDDPKFMFHAARNRELQKHGWAADFRLDLAVTRPGSVVAGFEVVAWHYIEPGKIEWLRRMPFPTVEIHADWVMSEPRRPDNWAAGIIDIYGNSQ
jgi:hypothetical protein